MKIVPVQHRNGGYTYVFSTPEDLHEGDIVLCQTKKGTDIGVCKTDSFEAEGKVLEYILSQSGTSVEKIKPVLGVYVYSEFQNKSENPTSETICGIPADTPIDTPIWVWEKYKLYRVKRHFAGFENGGVLTWACGMTSWSADNGEKFLWEHAELAKEETI